MQIRRFIGIIALCMISMAALAQHITSQEAMERATKFLKDKNLSSHSESMAAPVRRDVKLKETEVDVKNIYVFNADGGGYVIASADERTLPVLGYSDQGNIDWEQLPANMQAWLKSYDDAMATLGERDDFKDGDYQPKGTVSVPNSPSRTERRAIEPLIKSKWNQDDPYWNDIPLYAGANKNWTGQHCYTGCIATSMAQIMNYYQWPKTPTKGIPAYSISTIKDGKSKVWQIDSLPPVSFDWDNMLDKYVRINPHTQKQTILGNKDQRQAVSTLMRYCAQSVEMELSPEGSGAKASAFAQAMYLYFDYDPSAYYATRFSYGIDEWETLIYDELAAGRPVPYSGSSNPSSGHSFICDGYDGDGLFHINWGWNGSYDGFFSLSVLNPQSYGVGFCMNQGATLGIRPSSPDTLQESPLFYARMFDHIEIAGDTLKIRYMFSSNIYQDPSLANRYQSVLQDYAMGTIEQDGTLNPLFPGDPSDSIVYDYNQITVIIDPDKLEPLKLMTLYPMIRFRTIPGSDWQLLAGQQYGIYAIRSLAGSQILLHTNKPQLEINDANIRYYSTQNGTRKCYLTLTINNYSKFDFSGTVGVYPFYYGDIKAEDITDDTPYIAGNKAWSSGAHILSNEATDVIFEIVPAQNGMTRLWLYSDPFGYLTYYDILLDGNDSDGVSDILNDMKTDTYYDLNGRNVNGIPVRKGIYIRGKEKVLIE